MVILRHQEYKLLPNILLPQPIFRFLLANQAHFVYYSASNRERDIFF